MTPLVPYSVYKSNVHKQNTVFHGTLNTLWDHILHRLSIHADVRMSENLKPRECFENFPRAISLAYKRASVLRREGGRWRKVVFARAKRPKQRTNSEGAHIERENNAREKGRRGHRRSGGGWEAREKGGNGARYGEMARKLGIVMGNGRRSTPLTERKLEPEERSWEDTAILRERSLREPIPQRVPLVEGGAQRRKRTRISKERESRERGRKERPEKPCEIRRWKEETVGLLLSIRPPFLYLSFPFFGP